jgi:dextranase
VTELLQRKATVAVRLLSKKATFAPTDVVEVDVLGVDHAVRVTLWHLDRRVAEVTVEPGQTASFPPQPEGGYGVEAAGETAALDVLDDPLSRPRYGFVSHYEPGRETAGVATLVRRLHLNAVQFYDWMYRHARLLPPQDEFEDALGQPVSLTTVRELVEAVQEAGSLPMAYAAVYAVGKDERERWKDIALYRSDGKPWTLGEDFLWIVDPTNERWLAVFANELRGAMQQVGFAGFHLDQYGAPKRALRAGGTVIDLAEEFPRLINRLAAELPGARLIFNNVNDFPTSTTANAEQAAIYIEVWPPHEQLAHLAELVSKARRLAPGKGVILAAYLAPYSGDHETASGAERLLLATVFSHGGSVLLHGEERAALTEAYYVRHAELADGFVEVARRYYDFAVRYGDLLFDAGATDITRTHHSGENQEIKVDAPVPVATDCVPGVLWARVVRCSHGLLVSLIDLSEQTDTLWNAPKRSAGVLSGVRVALERTSPTSIFFASPESSPALQRLEPERDGRYDAVSLPPFSTWALIWVRDETATVAAATTTKTTEA